MRIRSFMLEGMDGFESLEDAADAIAAYIPHRPRPRRPLRAAQEPAPTDDGRWYWHWDPRFVRGRDGAIDGQEGLVDHDRPRPPPGGSASRRCWSADG